MVTWRKSVGLRPLGRAILAGFAVLMEIGSYRFWSGLSLD
jgi:hypothetical protein